MRQACNACDTIDYTGELDEAGVCAECRAQGTHESEPIMMTYEEAVTFLAGDDGPPDDIEAYDEAVGVVIEKGFKGYWRKALRAMEAPELDAVIRTLARKEYAEMQAIRAAH